MAAFVLALDIPARPDLVSIVRLTVAAAVRRRRIVSDERVADLVLALSEACTNAVEAHQQAGTPDAPIAVRIEEDEERFVVVVEDRGAGFDPMALPEHPAVTDPARLDYERGLGIPIIKTSVDEVTFRSDEHGTTVTMVIVAPPVDRQLLMRTADDI